jgi:hypothetical protein
VRRLRPDFEASIVLTATTASLPLNHSDIGLVWIFEQITANYTKTTDNPLVSVSKNGKVYAAPGIMLPGLTGLSTTFSGLPYLILESDDDGQVLLTGGSIGETFSIIGQKYEVDYNHPDLEGR